jgi:hypothetical protein
MGSVYSNAILTISAVAAPDSQYGILRTRKGIYSPPIGKLKNKCFRQSISRTLYSPEGPLSSRGWAAQERMLSPRILHYQADEMVWECGHGWLLEGQDHSDDHSYEIYVSDEVRQLGSSSSYFSKQPRRRFIGGVFEPDVVWNYFLQDYSGRALTVPSDKLPAIAGVAEDFSKGAFGHYIAGIWTQDIGYHLSWSRDTSYSAQSPLFKAPHYRAPS